MSLESQVDFSNSVNIHPQLNFFEVCFKYKQKVIHHPNTCRMFRSHWKQSFIIIILNLETKNATDNFLGWKASLSDVTIMG